MWAVQVLFASALLVSVLGYSSLEKGSDCQEDDANSELYITASAKTAPHQGLEETSCPEDDSGSRRQKRSADKKKTKKKTKKSIKKKSSKKCKPECKSDCKKDDCKCKKDDCCCCCS